MVMFDTTPKCNLLLHMFFNDFDSCYFCVDGCSLISTRGQSTCLMVGILVAILSLNAKKNFRAEYLKISFSMFEESEPYQVGGRDHYIICALFSKIF